jgi:hypothetical protein
MQAAHFVMRQDMAQYQTGLFDWFGRMRQKNAETALNRSRRVIRTQVHEKNENNRISGVFI